MKNSLFLFVGLALTAAAGCDSTAELDDDAGTSDTDTDTDTDGDTDTDTDSDTDSDSDSDADGGESDCGAPWGWYDETSGLCWENPPTSTDEVYVEEAITYCDSLSLGGHDDWRLPSISELRSFIRGCAATMTGGECGVTDECTLQSECWSSSCVNGNGCEVGTGPGVDGYYWDPEIIAGGAFNYWSSTPEVPSDYYHTWTIQFSSAFVISTEVPITTQFRCVRSGL
jgi:hypothetical protein